MSLPVSVKGVLISDERAVVLRNKRDERNEWELPGGRLESGEDLRDCVERETREELNLRAEAGPLLDAYVYEVVEDRFVFIVVYGCSAGSLDGLEHSAEHTEVALFGGEELGDVPLPKSYRKSIESWLAHPERLKGRE